MRAALQLEPGPDRLALADFAEPVPGPGEVLVRVSHVGLCGTDLLVVDGGYRGRRRPLLSPLILGHEASGVVVEGGEGVRGLAPGTRVAMEAVIGCGQCPPCAAGNYNACSKWDHLGLTRQGALAEFVVMPSSSIWELPEQVSLEAGALIEPLATAVHTFERVRPRPDTTVAIIGPGPLGLLHLQVLRARGVRSVVVYGRAGDEARLSVAGSLGAEVFLGDRDQIAVHAMERTAGHGYGLSIEVGGTAQAIQSALEIVGPVGALVSLGVVPPTEIDVLQVMRKELTWHGVIASVGDHFAEAITMVQLGLVSPEAIVTHRLALENIVAGFDVMRRRHAVKVLVHCTR